MVLRLRQQSQVLATEFYRGKLAHCSVDCGRRSMYYILCTCGLEARFHSRSRWRHNLSPLRRSLLASGLASCVRHARHSAVLRDSRYCKRLPPDGGRRQTGMASRKIQSSRAAKAFQVPQTLKQPCGDCIRIVAVAQETVGIANREDRQALVGAQGTNRHLQGIRAVGITVAGNEHDTTISAYLPKFAVDRFMRQP